jgi:hypothetical protein
VPYSRLGRSTGALSSTACSRRAAGATAISHTDPLPARFAAAGPVAVKHGEAESQRTDLFIITTIKRGQRAGEAPLPEA